MGDVLSTVGGVSCSMVEGREDGTQRVGVSPRDVPPTLLPIIQYSADEFKCASANNGPIEVSRLHPKVLDTTPLS